MNERQPIFSVIEAKKAGVPILIHLPHSGTFVPDSIKSSLLGHKADELDETDWYLDILYEFALDMGIDIYKANYSRWVVDLNRNPDGMSLYSDGRVITDVVPSTDFNGEFLYKGAAPDKQEREDRLDSYFYPYYQRLQEHLDGMLEKFGRVLLWDGHSIRRHVPGIQTNQFPDLIVGSSDGKSAPNWLADCALDELRSSGLDITHNNPFKGGNITRSFHDLDRKIYTIQLEMCKDLYMDDSEVNYDSERAQRITILLERTLTSILEKL